MPIFYSYISYSLRDFFEIMELRKCDIEQTTGIHHIQWYNQINKDSIVSGYTVLLSYRMLSNANLIIRTNEKLHIEGGSCTFYIKFLLLFVKEIQSQKKIVLRNSNTKIIWGPRIEKKSTKQLQSTLEQIGF